MAGKIIADIIEAPVDRISLNVGNLTVLSANSSGLNFIPTGNVNVNIGGASANLTMNLLTANGIKFPGTQVSSADANTLDDYEEGTFTPIIRFGSTTATLTSSSAGYTKIGRQVTLMIEAYVTNLNGGTGLFSVGGFPFAAYSWNRQTEAQFYFQFMSASFPTAYMQAYIQPTDTQMGINYFTGSSGTSVSLTHSQFTTSSYFYAQINYFAS